MCEEIYFSISILLSSIIMQMLFTLHSHFDSFIHVTIYYKKKKRKLNYLSFRKINEFPVEILTLRKKKFSNAKRKMTTN
jgi:hypothetical protein